MGSFDFFFFFLIVGFFGRGFFKVGIRVRVLLGAISVPEREENVRWGGFDFDEVFFEMVLPLRNAFEEKKYKV